MNQTMLNQSHQLYQAERLQNQHKQIDNYLSNSIILDEEPSTLHSQSDIDSSRIEFPNEDDRKNDSNDKESMQAEIFEERQRLFDNKQIKPRKHTSVLRGFLQECSRQALHFICFGQKKVELTRDEVKSFLARKFGEDGMCRVTGRLLIEEVIRKMCLNEMGFEPCQIKTSTFNLTAVEMEADCKKQTIANGWQLQQLYKCDYLLISRVSRTVELSNYYQDLQERNKEVEILQILSPDQRDLIEVIERGRTYGELKQKLLTYYYQMVGRIVLVSYHSFKLLDSKRKIGDLPQRIVQIYQEKAWEYQDRIFQKRNNAEVCIAECTRIYAAQERNPPVTEELLVNDSLIHGSLYLQVRKNQLVERYHGGLLGYLITDRLICRSLLTLTAVKIIESQLYLEFKYKHTSEVVVYEFSSLNQLNELINAVLVVVRHYNHRIEVMD